MDLAGDASGTAAGPGHLRYLLALAEAGLLAQRGHLLPWAPVALGTGMGLYFALPAEPGQTGWIAVALAGVLGLLLARRLPSGFVPLAWVLALVASGVGLAGHRAWVVAAPVLEFRYYGPIEGRIVEIDRSASDALRLTLDRVVLDGIDPARRPERVRISLRGDQRWLVAEPGRVVMLTGHLAPPSGPAEPGDFDFRRAAWFERLGAVGYTQSPVLTRAPPGGGLWLHRLRMRLSDGIKARIEGDAGGLAAAMATGDRSGISAQANEVMRDSGLYHLVSISGTHMGLLVAFVFGLVRTSVALVPPLALRVNGKKMAALVALPVATFYLALAGRDVATERAFVMVAVMLGAVLCDRQAITLRSVGIAALIVLVLRPESLMNAGFQMSFAAVTALSVILGRANWTGNGRWRWAAPVAMLVLSSLVAGLATAPYAGAQFNRFAAYGLLSNVLAAPAMGFLVMPGAALLGLGAGLGITQPALLILELGCRWILLVADLVAGLEGAATSVMAPPPVVLPLFTGAGLLLILWRGRMRWGGAAGMALALGLWAGAGRPDLLIAPSGGTLAVQGEAGRALSRPTGDSFVVARWLENDGDLAGPDEAAGRPGLDRGDGLYGASVGGRTVLLVRGAKALAGIAGCGGADLLVTDQAAGARPCLVLDPDVLARTGAVAGWVEDGTLRLVSAEEVSGDRPWTRAGRDGPVPDLGP
ncbi:ComEC/Rec2 family competence protein [Rubellimicrobium roseum]|uniref:ComEC/Rec2 family competence protein n=1 Tax=Rubellimicrobium roseum TaxID=687525 RepID=UPI001FE81475|nr:ComEC/Rec2 family competence protein [Rubellimicrobium roseum]